MVVVCRNDTPSQVGGATTSGVQVLWSRRDRALVGQRLGGTMRLGHISGNPATRTQKSAHISHTPSQSANPAKPRQKMSKHPTRAPRTNEVCIEF